MLFPRDEYEKRWSGLQAELKRRGYACAVFWQRTGGSYDGAGDVYYLTNYASHSSGVEPSYGAAATRGRGIAALLVQVGRDPELHTAEPAEIIDTDNVVCGQLFGHNENLAIGFGKRLRELHLSGRVASQGEAFLPVEVYRELVPEVPDIEFVPEFDLLFNLQNHKSSRELDLYRQVGELSSKALTVLMEGLIKGDRECDAAARAASLIMTAGGGFQRIACHHGRKSEFAMWNNPLYGYSTESPDAGEMVRGWVYGPILGGYWIDPGRTAVCGDKPDAATRKLIEETVTVVKTVIDAHRPGITPREVGAIGDKVMQKLGYGQDLGAAIWDLYGHSVSTYWLPPVIPAFGHVTDKKVAGWHVDEPFHVGQVCTVEIFMHKADVGTATYEHAFILKDAGVEDLTTTPMIFW